MTPAKQLEKTRDKRTRFQRNLLIIKTHGSMLFATLESAKDFVNRARRNNVELKCIKKSCGYLVVKKGAHYEFAKTI